MKKHGEMDHENELFVMFLPTKRLCKLYFSRPVRSLVHFSVLSVVLWLFGSFFRSFVHFSVHFSALSFFFLFFRSFCRSFGRSFVIWFFLPFGTSENFEVKFQKERKRKEKRNFSVKRKKETVQAGDLMLFSKILF